MTGDHELSASDRERLKGQVDATLADGEEGTRHLLRTLQQIHRGSGGNGNRTTHRVSSQARG
jgi:hypothetical protein